MANIDFKSAVVRLTFEAGQTQDGKVIKKARLYRNVDESASADQLAEVAAVLSGFSSYPLIDAEKIETSDITN